MTLLDVAVGKVTGPLPVALLLKVRLPGVVPAATAHVHSKTTGSPVPDAWLSGLVRTGPVRLEHPAPAVDVTARVPALTLVTGVEDDRVNVTLTASPVTARDRDPVMAVNRP